MRRSSCRAVRRSDGGTRSTVRQATRPGCSRCQGRSSAGAEHRRRSAARRRRGCPAWPGPHERRRGCRRAKTTANARRQEETSTARRAVAAASPALRLGSTRRYAGGERRRHRAPPRPSAHRCGALRRRRRAAAAAAESVSSSSSATFRSRHRLIAARRLLAQAADDGPLDVERHDAADRLGGAGSSFRIFARTDSGESPMNGRTAGHHLVQHRAEAEDVRPRVDLAALRLFGRHVRGRADDLPPRSAATVRVRRRGAIGRLEQLRQPEVEDLDAIVVGDHHVRRLQVTVDDAGFVRRGEGIGNLHAVAQRLRDGEALRGITASSVRPPTYSMTMKSIPSSDPMSWRVTIFG